MGNDRHIQPISQIEHEKDHDQASLAVELNEVCADDRLISN